MTLNLALSYSSREEILDAVKKLIADYSKQLIDIEHITEKVFQNIYTTQNCQMLIY